MTQPNPRPAGRPRLRGERKLTTAIRMTPTLKSYLESQPVSASEFIESALRRTADFKRWEAERT